MGGGKSALFFCAEEGVFIGDFSFSGKIGGLAGKAGGRV
jgi:hypothetical protein